MLSSDRNVETIAELVEVIKHYIELQKDFLRLDAVEKTVKLITAMAMLAVFSAMVLFILIYLSFGVACALSPYVGEAAAFCIVATFYFVVLLVFIIFRKQWIEKPLVRFFANILIK